MLASLSLLISCHKAPPPPPPEPAPEPVRDELAEAQALLSGSSSRPSGGSGGGPRGGTEGAPIATDAGPVTAKAWVVLDDPCEGAGTPYALYFRDTKQGFVGCGEGVGLFETLDGGASFTRAHPSDDLYVFHLIDDAQGRLLVCGHDYAPVEGSVMLYRESARGWEDLMWFSGDPSDRGAANMSNCGRIAELDDGTLVAVSLTIGDLTWSTDGGRSWSPMERYWEESNLNGQKSAWPLWDLEAIGGELYASGSQMSMSPGFFLPSGHPRARQHSMRRVVVEPDIRGEAQAMATSDGGQTWVVGGRDQDRSREASGFLYVSTDGGESWASAVVADTIDVVKDIQFSEDGRLGVAVGHRYPPRAKGGFVLLSGDGGRSWAPLDVTVPPLQSVSVVGDHFWVAGDRFLARGIL